MMVEYTVEKGQDKAQQFNSGTYVRDAELGPLGPTLILNIGTY